MLQVKINEDISEVKERLWLGLTLRQWIFAGIGVGLGIIIAFILWERVPMPIIVITTIPAIAIISLLGWTEKWFTFKSGDLIRTIITYCAQPKTVYPDGELINPQKRKKDRK